MTVRQKEKAASIEGPLATAFEAAVRGNHDTLERFLCRTSRLPGDHPNVELAKSFAEMVASRGKDGDKVGLRLALLPPEEATAATAREFLPMCGTLALGASAAKHENLRKRYLSILHELADDWRFRVRDMVPIALVPIGEAMGDKIFAHLDPWLDGFFHAAAILRAATDRRWLSACKDPDHFVEALNRSFHLLADAPRSLERYPGYKSLLEAMPPAVHAFASRFGAPILDVVETWVKVKEPMLRDMIEASLAKLTKIAPEEVKRIRGGLKATAPIPRDPTLLREGMRRRGRKREARK